MKNLEIKVNRNTSMVYLENTILGNDGESLQGDIIFSFVNDFVDGQARLEYEIEGEKRYLFLTKDEETYKTPIKSVLTKNGAINMQLVVTEGVSEDEIPIFKSNVFYVYCNDSLNAEIEQPEQYNEWIDVANQKLNTIDVAVEQASNLNADVVKQGSISTLTIVNKENEEKVVDVYDGETPILEIGTITTGNPGTDAEVTMTQDGTNYTLDFTIPRGNKGDKGERGEKGDKGDTGNTGATGKDGVTPTLKVGTTTTGEAGTNAEVTMIPNGTEYTLNFTIPKGDKGEAGEGGGSDVDLSNYYTKPEIDNKKYITNSITTDFNVGKSIYLNTIGSSVNTNSNSKLVFGTVDNVFSWITSNTSGAFAFSKGSGNITIYPKTSQYNCIMSDCDSDLGRTDKPWKNIYFNGVLSNGSVSIAMNKIANKDNYYTKAEIDAMLVNGDEVSY